MQIFKVFIATIAIFPIVSCGSLAKDSTSEEQINEEILMNKENLLENQYKAVAYSGFRSGQHPDRGDGAVNPSYDEILEDLQILTKDSNFGLLRLYDCKENSELVLKVIKENDIKMKVLLGIWLDAELSAHESCFWLNEPIPQEKLDLNRQANIGEVEKGIQLANEYKDIIVAVNVGNEALVDWNDHMVNVDSVINYVRKVKAKIEQPVTVADNYKWWADMGADLAEEVDFLSIHVYPVWLGYDIDSGMTKTIAEFMEVKRAHPGKKIVITEAGWASVASEFGERASEEKQMQYYNEMMNWSNKNNITTFFFEAFDEDWKGNPNNPLGAEKHWGLFTVDRKAKQVMHELYPELLQ